jgi:tripartite-type tricarboxylate transporter receptor subunit TctC
MIVAFAATVATASAQSYPTRSVRLIVPAAAGGPSDIMARIIAQKLSEAWGQQFIVEKYADRRR